MFSWIGLAGGLFQCEIPEVPTWQRFMTISWDSAAPINPGLAGSS